MKIVYLIALAVAACSLTACQSDQETLQTPMSSVHKDRSLGQPDKGHDAPELSGARDATLPLQAEILAYVNQARSQTCLCGTTTYPAVPALSLNSRLNGEADKFAVDMATYNYFSHTGRNGSQPWDRMTQEGYQWSSSGENIAAGYPTARSVVDGWLGSTGHCQNIMSADYQNLGVGYAYSASSSYIYYWVIDFGTRQ